MTIFEEVFAVAKAEGVKEQGPAQSEQDFLFSILKAVNGCSNEAWNALSAESQSWAEVAIKENNARKPIPAPLGYHSNIPIPVPVAPVPSKVQVKVQPAPVAATNIPKAKPKPEGVVSAIRKTIILNPDWPTRKVHEYLVGNGWPNLKLDVVSVNAGDIRRTVAMVKEVGKWRE